MHYYSNDNLQVVDQDDLHAYGDLGLADHYMTIEAMTGKQQYGSFDLNFGGNGALPYLPTDYETPSTDQSDLAALPKAMGNDFDHGFLYTPAHSEHCSRNSVTSIASAPYASLPVSSATQYNPATYTTVPASKKRRASLDSYEQVMPAAKRIHVEVIDPSGEYYEVKDEASPYSSVVPTPTTMPGAYGPYQLTGSPRTQGHQHSTSNVSQMSLPVTAPYTPTVSPSFTTANTEHSPRAPATPDPRPDSVGPNPKLVRTSTIPSHSPQAIPSSMTLVGHTQNFNPYTLYSPDSKARLHMQGNLDDVAKKWSEKELEAHRKIIVFNRSQKGNDIYADFEVVSQENWKNHPRSVSCIWWAEKKEAYVTSVDTILLLEALVAARFTVEEKNRIRRNLEGFKPDTVSKAKADTEEFFKIIMGFPTPKPRNIEKDVKVFPWRILSVALQKIISKYSASYASTASSLASQPKMGPRTLEFPDFAYSTSPQPEYHNGMQVANFPSYEHQGRLSAPATPAPAMHAISTMAQFDHDLYGQYHGQMPAQSHGRFRGPSMPNTPGYWQQQNGMYAGEGHMPMVASSAPANYSRDMIQTADFRHMYAGYHH